MCRFSNPIPGGPLETIEQNVTGLFISEPFNKIEMAKTIMQFVKNEELSKKLGKNGPAHVERLFSFTAFATKLDEIITKLF